MKQLWSDGDWLDPQGHAARQMTPAAHLQQRANGWLLGCGLWSFGSWCRVLLQVINNVSEEPTGCIFMLEMSSYSASLYEAVQKCKKSSPSKVIPEIAKDTQLHKHCPDDGDSKHLRNVGKLEDHMAQQPLRQPSVTVTFSKTSYYWPCLSNITITSVGFPFSKRTNYVDIHYRNHKIPPLNCTVPFQYLSPFHDCLANYPFYLGTPAKILYEFLIPTRTTWPTHLILSVLLP